MNNVERFKKEIEPFILGWNSIEVRTACFIQNSKWVNFGTRIVLSEKLPKDIVLLNTLPEFDGFKTLHEVYPISTLDEILAQLKKGILTIRDNNIYFNFKYEKENHVIKSIPPSLSIYKEKMFDRFALRSFSFTRVILSGGESVHTLFNNSTGAIDQEYLDNGLRSCKVPYSGLNDLLVNFVGVPRPEYDNIESTSIEIIAPIQLRLGNDCKLSDGKLIIHVEVIGFDDPEDVLIGLIAYSESNAPYRTSFVLIDTDWRKENGGLVTYKEISINDVTSVDIFLSFKGEFLDKLTVIDPLALLNNPRILVYNHFDKDLEVLERYLASLNSEAFEIGVSLLIHFCGFNTGSYYLLKGKKGLSGIHEEIDVIAFAPDSNVIAVECTIGDIYCGRSFIYDPHNPGK